MVVTFLHNRIHNVAEEFRRGTFVQRCSQLSFGVLCLFLLECSITGGGRYWEAGPVSIRILLGGLAAVLALPELFRHLEHPLTGAEHTATRAGAGSPLPTAANRKYT